MIQQVFIDESGFTGTDLLNQAQPHFVFSGVSIPSEKTEEIFKELRSRFSFRETELKGKKLTGLKMGQNAISWILLELQVYFRVVVFNKKYALCWKFFEYMFEPVIAPQSSIFYREEFNYYIAMLLYLELSAYDNMPLMRYVKAFRRLSQVRKPSFENS